MRIGKRLGLCALLSCAFHVSPATAESGYPPPPYHESEKVCEAAVGTAATMVCLSDLLNEARESLDQVVALLENAGAGSDESRPLLEAFGQAQERWREDVDATCNRMLELKYEGGTMARTEPVRCELLMTRERERLIRILYYQQLRYLEQRPERSPEAEQ